MNPTRSRRRMSPYLLIPVVIDAAISAGIDAVISVIDRQDTVIPDVIGVMISGSIDAVIHVIDDFMCFIDTVILVLSICCRVDEDEQLTSCHKLRSSGTISDLYFIMFITYVYFFVIT